MSQPESLVGGVIVESHYLGQFLLSWAVRLKPRRHTEVISTTNSWPKVGHIVPEMLQITEPATHGVPTVFSSKMILGQGLGGEGQRDSEFVSLQELLLDITEEEVTTWARNGLCRACCIYLKSPP